MTLRSRCLLAVLLLLGLLGTAGCGPDGGEAADRSAEGPLPVAPPPFDWERQCRTLAEYFSAPYPDYDPWGDVKARECDEHAPGWREAMVESVPESEGAP